MKKALGQDYIDEINQNHDITGVPRVRAEWNWNNTSLLSDGAKRGPIMRIYNNANGTGSNKTEMATINSAASLSNVFQPARLKKTMNYSSINWDNNSNTPNVSFDPVLFGPNYLPQSEMYFGVEQEFYLEVRESGTWRFFVQSDDSQEVYINDVKVSSAYGTRERAYFPNYNETFTYTFPVAGRYKFKTRLYNWRLHWGFYLYYQTPSMIGAKRTMQEVQNDMVIHPEDALIPKDNPQIIGYNADSAAVQPWKAWREYFPVKSIVEPFRPTSGIHYNELSPRNDDCFIMTPANFVFEPSKPRPPRYYLLNKGDQTYRYWKSDQVSSATGVLSGATVRVNYTDWIGVNKVLLTFNLGPLPTSLTVRYLTRDTSGAEIWVNMIGPNDAIPMDTGTGELNLYRNSDGLWLGQSSNEDQQTIYKEDYSVEMKAIEFTVHRINKSASRVEVIEFSARKQLDITDRVINLSADLTMDEEDWTRILGKSSANSGQIAISNWDNAFQLDDAAAIAQGVEKLKQTTERSTKITADLLYDLTERGGSHAYPIRLFTMYSADWSRKSEFDYDLRLYDSAKFLQNMPCPEVYEKNIPVHALLAQVLDSVGFGRYAIDREDYSLSAPVLDYFANDAEATVWEVIQSICESAMCAVYFDEYDVLQLLTKEEITKLRKADYVLRGQVDPDFPENLPNIQDFQKAYEMEANKASIKWRTHAVKKSKDPINQQELTDIVWQSSETITLRATKLVKPLSYSEEEYFYIKQEDAAAWPFSGKANVNGETIEWEGKEYFFIDNTTTPPMRINEVIYSTEEWQQRNAKSVYGYVVGATNKFTGKIRFKRDVKTGKPIGRATDSSKFRLDHPTEKRAGWLNGTFTVGDNNGFFPGTNPYQRNGCWNGEENSFGYIVNSDSTTALGWNRPNTPAANWFRTQTMFRKEETPQVLQQWGFKMKFKESQTIGEVSLMFNVGQSFGNSEVATTAGPSSLWNQMYHLTFLETQGLVRDATHEIAAWVQTPDPVYRKQDNAIRGTASRMYNRNYDQPWSERMKGYQYEFKRDQWYDIKVDLTRGRGYNLNSSMHFYVWVNGSPVAGFDAAGPANRHKFLAPTNAWAIGSRAASKIEIANAYSWTEFADPVYEEESYRYDFTSGGYVSSYLENGILYPSPGKSSPFKDGGPLSGELFLDDFGSTLHEIREYDITLDKAPVESVKTVISNPSVRNLELTYSPNKAKFSVVNVSDKDVIAHGQEDLPGGGNVNHSMVLYGYVLEEGEEQTITRQDRDSIKDHGEVKMDIDAKWVNNADQANNMADWVVRHFSDPKDVIEITGFADTSYSVGDKVNIHYDKAEVDKTWLYIISKVSISYSGDSGLEVGLTVRRVRDNPVTDDYE